LAEFTILLAKIYVYWRFQQVFWRKKHFIGDVHNFIGELEIPNDFFQMLCHKSVRYITVGGSETLYNVSV
jgi:hypothetical protein